MEDRKGNGKTEVAVRVAESCYGAMMALPERDQRSMAEMMVRAWDRRLQADPELRGSSGHVVESLVSVSGRCYEVEASVQRCADGQLELTIRSLRPLTGEAAEAKTQQMRADATSEYVEARDLCDRTCWQELAGSEPGVEQALKELLTADNMAMCLALEQPEVRAALLELVGEQVVAVLDTIRVAALEVLAARKEPLKPTLKAVSVGDARMVAVMVAARMEPLIRSASAQATEHDREWGRLPYETFTRFKRENAGQMELFREAKAAALKDFGQTLAAAIQFVERVSATRKAGEPCCFRSSWKLGSRYFFTEAGYVVDMPKRVDVFMGRFEEVSEADVRDLVAAADETYPLGKDGVVCFMPDREKGGAQ